jgi:hypothetical protein
MTSKIIKENITKNKMYIIPTNEWLQPIKPLLTDDINSRSLLMLSKLADKEEVVVKITKNIDFYRTKVINNNIKYLPNMLYVFKTLECLESEINYDIKYKDCNGYCNKHESETENIKIVLEIMRKYEYSLTKYLTKKLSIIDIKLYR